MTIPSNDSAGGDAQSDPSRPTALVVDDEALVSYFLSDVLTDLGFDVVNAGTVQTALTTARAQAKLAVAFVDLGLPDRSGLELIAELQQLHPRLPIVIATGYGAMAQRDLKDDTQPPKFLTKPYSAAAVAEIIAELNIKV